MLALLEVLVCAESPTDVPEAQAEVQDALSRLLQTLDFAVQHLLDGDTCGGHLFAQPADRPAGQPVQLLNQFTDRPAFNIRDKATHERLDTLLRDRLRLEE